MDQRVIDSSRRAIPSVEKALQALGPLDLPRPVVVDAVRRELAEVRASGVVPAPEEIIQRLRSAVDRLRAARLQPVINATGITLHTNFGRAPLAAEAQASLAAIAAGYSNLEYDLVAGERGGRGAYLERCLALLCETEAATVVNNCAAALVLMLRHFTSMRPEVIISRGEMIQIGGGFRIPEIMEASGATLREVGTTNRTTLEDYARAVNDRTGLILKVHRSNFHMEGFVEDASAADLATLASNAGVPLVEDLGSGAIADTSRVAGLHREPSPADSLRSGASLVCFSGDKLFGGPQAGIIAGQTNLIQKLKRDPLFRALRCDKLVFAALQATAELHLAGRTFSGVPACAILDADDGELRTRATALAEALEGTGCSAQVGEAEAEVGGGTLPRSRVRSVTVNISPARGTLEQLAAKLREGTPPVIGYISGNRLKLDLRTVFPDQDALLLSAVRQALHSL